jgi:ATP-dependent Zn protease
MNKSRIIKVIAGAVLFLSIVMTFVFLFSSGSPRGSELAFDEAIAKIRNKEIKEALITEDRLSLNAKSNERFIVKLDSSEATRAEILNAVRETGTTIRLEPASHGWGWVLLASYLPFYLMWGLTLAVIVYAVRTLSRNKG